jgi:hypothetical protein
MSANKHFSTNIVNIPALKSFSSNYNPNNNTSITNLVMHDPKFPPPPSPSSIQKNICSHETTPIQATLDHKIFLKSPSKKFFQMNLFNLNNLENNNEEFKAEIENLEGIMKDLTEIQKKQKNFNI